jgi:hypothetical protein
MRWPIRSGAARGRNRRRGHGPQRLRRPWLSTTSRPREIPGRAVDGVAKGHGDPAVLGPRSTALNEERKRVVAELNAAPPAADIVSLHPAVLARYEQQLANLQDTLSRGV